MAVSNIELRVNGDKAVRELNRVNRSTGKLTNTVKQLAGAFAGVQAFKFVFTKTAELEKQRKSLQVLTGSLKEASKTIKELQQFAAVTPFTSADLIDTAKRLKAFGVETSKIVDTTKRLGDVAGATGAELNGIATAYGQIQAKGKLQTEELLQLQERGVDLASTLRKAYNLTGEEFSDALRKGQISAEAVEFALKELTSTGGQYANGAISQSTTLSGKLSTLQDNIETLARTLGSVLSPVLKGIFDQANQVLSALNRSLAAGRGASFNRQIGAIGTKLTFGLTSQSVDDVEKVLSQLSSQKNRIGIEQNITALNQLSNALARIGPGDPNAGRAVELQGQIMRRQLQESAALKKVPATQSLEAIDIPEMLGGNDEKEKRGSGRTEQSRVDASQKLLGLVEKLAFSIDTVSEKEKLVLELKIAQQRIIEQNLPSNQETIALLELQQRHMEAIISLEEKQAKALEKAAKERRDRAMNIVKEGFAQGQAADEQISKLTETEKLANSIGAQLGTGITDAIVGAVKGTKELGEAFQELAADILEAIGKALILRAVTAAIGSVGGGGGDDAGSGLLGLLFRADGGPVSANRPYVVGEEGPELFIPGASGSITNNQQFEAARASMSFYGGGGGTPTYSPNIQATTMPDGMQYVTVEQMNSTVQAGMKVAARQGAAGGQSRTMNALRNSRSQRSKIGLGR